MHLKILLSFVCLFYGWSAAAPIAKITVAKGLLINSKPVPDKIAPTWPVVGNDAITTTTNPAVLIMPKGDRALLEAKSAVRLFERDGVVTLELVGGELCLLVHGKSDLQILPSDAAVPITYPFEGSIILGASQQKAVVKRGGCRVRAGAFPAGQKAAIAAAALAGTATAALASGKAVAAASPSQP